MTTHTQRLRLVRPEPEGASELDTRGGDLALIASILAINLVPVVGEFLHPGRWGAGTVAFATLCVVLSARELLSQLRDLRRSRR